MRSGVWIPDQVRPREEFAGSVVIVKEVHIKRIARPQSQDPIELPARANSRIPLPQRGHVVTECPHEAMAIVEVRAGLLLVDPVAVIRLSRVCYVVLSI